VLRYLWIDEPRPAEARECYLAERAFEIRTYRTQADLDAAVKALSTYCGYRTVGERWMIEGNTLDAAELARSRVGGRVVTLAGCTPGAPGWGDPPYDVQALGCAKGARAAVNVQVPDVRSGDIKFTVSDTGPTGRRTLFDAGSAVEGSRWLVPLEIPVGCEGHTQTITITNSSATPSGGVVKRSAVEPLTFTRRADGVFVANVRPVLRDNGTVSGSAALSDEGRLLWNFDALLHETFGTADVSADRNFNFTDYDARCGSKCGPSADHPGYAYTFENASGSAFHIAEEPFGPDVVFGAHPVPVLINDLPVACDAAASQFLIRYGGVVSFTLGCLSPAN
jgi:hypothetical protein